MTAPRRDETTNVLSDAEVQRAYCDTRDSVRLLRPAEVSPWLYATNEQVGFIRAFARAIERVVVSALSARGGEPSDEEKLEALNRVSRANGERHFTSMAQVARLFREALDAGVALGRRHAVSPEARGGAVSEEAAAAAWVRQNDRVRGRVEGQYGPYTNADWQDVCALHRALGASRATDEAALSAKFDEGAEAGRAECERTHEAMIREAVRNALTEAMYDLPGDYSAPAYIALRDFRDREYPLPVPPAPKGVTLTWSLGGYRRWHLSDATGRIVGAVEESSRAYVGYHRGKEVGDYVSEDSAKKAVEAAERSHLALAEAPDA